MAFARKQLSGAFSAPAADNLALRNGQEEHRRTFPTGEKGVPHTYTVTAYKAMKAERARKKEAQHNARNGNVQKNDGAKL